MLLVVWLWDVWGDRVGSGSVLELEIWGMKFNVGEFCRSHFHFTCCDSEVKLWEEAGMSGRWVSG